MAENKVFNVLILFLFGVSQNESSFAEAKPCQISKTKIF